MVGLPFVVVATTGPLLQKWYSWTRAAGADDPYFLFAASNLGSFGWACWPTRSLVESRLIAGRPADLVVRGVRRLRAAHRRVLRGHRGPPGTGRSTASTGPVARDPVRIARGCCAGWRWRSCPRPCCSAATSHLSTDVASIPLLWVVPLAVYLATFVLAFARRSRHAGPRRHPRRGGAWGSSRCCCRCAAPRHRIAVGVASSLLMLGLVAFAAHSQLAVDRPSTEHLTTFYLVIAAGGALGGLLNGLVAPSVFARRAGSTPSPCSRSRCCWSGSRRRGPAGSPGRCWPTGCGWRAPPWWPCSSLLGAAVAAHPARHPRSCW